MQRHFCLRYLNKIKGHTAFTRNLALPQSLFRSSYPDRIEPSGVLALHSCAVNSIQLTSFRTLPFCYYRPHPPPRRRNSPTAPRGKHNNHQQPSPGSDTSLWQKRTQPRLLERGCPDSQQKVISSKPASERALPTLGPPKQSCSAHRCSSGEQSGCAGATRAS